MVIDVTHMYMHYKEHLRTLCTLNSNMYYIKHLGMKSFCECRKTPLLHSKTQSHCTLIFLTQIVGKTLWSSIQLRKFSPSNYFPYLLLYSAKVLTVENLDEWLAIHKSFPYKPLSLNVSPLKPTINLSKLFIRQSFLRQIFAL